MITIKCESCGKSYDYIKHDLCPRCGAYNSPSDEQRAEITRQTRQKNGLTVDGEVRGYYNRSDEQTRFGESRGYAGTAGERFAGSRAGETTRGGMDAGALRRLAIGIAVAAVVIVLIVAAVAVFSQLSRHTDNEMKFVSVAQGDTFLFGDADIKVTGCHTVENSGGRELPEGQKVVAVIVSSSGGGEYNSDQTEPYVMYNGKCQEAAYDYMLEEFCGELDFGSSGGLSAWEGETPFYFIVDSDCVKLTFCLEEIDSSFGESYPAWVYEIDLSVGEEAAA